MKHSNPLFRLASDFIHFTGYPVFLTGKAGTGKTTFLKYIRETSVKKMAVTAPTGVAAINAGGLTLHSLFQLPSGIYLPEQRPVWQQAGNQYVHNEYSLLAGQRISKTKRDLIKALELLIIDEISMVRCDCLDAIDVILRKIRKSDAPFGGVQLLFIGDLFQLPPVVKKEEWQLLSKYYSSPYFFDAQVVKKQMPVIIELEKVYRQSDDRFLSVLNKIRNNNIGSADMEVLRNCYQPNFNPTQDEGYITLTTHNYIAAKINDAALNQLASKSQVIDAKISGDFPENSFPVTDRLVLKKGAQIMFIKNDKGENRKFFNGKIGVVKSITADEIIVNDGEQDIAVKPETWRNLQLNYNQETDEVEELELGAFTQFPLKLAWAVTVHKSQGLTFEKAVVDCGNAFAPGQVYVALSRLTSLEGLILKTPLQPSTICTDATILRYMQQQLSTQELTDLLIAEKKKFLKTALIGAFNFSSLQQTLLQNASAYDKRQIKKREEAEEWAMQMVHNFYGIDDVAKKFQQQIAALLASGEIDALKERLEKAATHFKKSFDTELLQPLQQHIQLYKTYPKAKKYLVELMAIGNQLENACMKIERLPLMLQDDDAEDFPTPNKSIQKTSAFNASDLSAAKPKKGDTLKETLRLRKLGHSASEIAALRNLAASTIDTHFAQLVEAQEIPLSDFLSEDTIQAIHAAIAYNQSTAASVLFNALKKKYSYGQIRAAVYHYQQSMQNA